MLLIDLSHTSHSEGNTGIQRVCRSLHGGLSSLTTTNAVCYDPYLKAWRYLAGKECELAKGLTSRKPGRKRGSRWSLSQKMRSTLARYGLSVGYKSLHSGNAHEVSGFVVPEIFTPKVAVSYRGLFPALKAPKIAVFHDAVALRFPDISPAATVKRMPDYLNELRMFDGIAANSKASRDELLAYWANEGVENHPRVEAIPLGTDFKSAGADPAMWQRKKILVVGTFEGRKNHLALLDAFEQLWESGKVFEVEFCGAVNQETGTAAVNRLECLRSKGRALRWNGALSDLELTKAYESCSFTVYPSLYEGFGLPVLESLSFGRPCVCTTYGALKEASADGGCVHLKDGNAGSITEGVDRLLRDSQLYGKLCDEIDKRTFRNWTDYSKDVLAFVDGLKDPHRDHG